MKEGKKNKFNWKLFWGITVGFTVFSIITVKSPIGEDVIYVVSNILGRLACSGVLGVIVVLIWSRINKK